MKATSKLMVLILLTIAWSEAACLGGETNAVRAKIVGAWRDAGEATGSSGERRTQFNSDGTYVETLRLVLKSKEKKVTVTGKWETDGSTLKTVVSTCTEPEGEKPGDVTKMKVLSITDTTLVIQYDDGEKETLSKVKK